MAGDMYDAVSWRNLQGKAGHKVGYADGPVSKWPPEAWSALDGVIPWKITVLADGAHELFDHESGNAPAAQIANAVERRLRGGKWSVCYTNHSELGPLEAALRSLGVRWAPAEAWPAVGVYLWAAHPGTTPGTIPSWCPTRPVAVQDRWTEAFDVSSTYGAFPQASARPGPVSPPVPQRPTPAPGPEEENMTAYFDGNQHHIYRERADGGVDHWWRDHGQKDPGWQHEQLPAA